MKKIIFLLCLIFVSFSSFAQQNHIDSLKNELKTEQVENKRLELLYELCNTVLTTDFSEEHKKELDEQIELAKKLGNDTYLVSAYQNYSTYYAFRREPKFAIEKIRVAKHLADSLKDYLSLQQCTSQEAALLADLGAEKEEIEKLLLQSVRVADENNLTGEMKANALASAALYYQTHNDDDNAIAYYLKALSIFDKKMPDTFFLQGYLNCFRGLAWIYIDRKQYNKAQKYATQGLTILKNITYEHEWFFAASYHRILGRIYTNQKEYEKAVVEFLTILKNGNRNGVELKFDINKQISYSYCKLKEYDKALKHADIAINVAEQLKDSLMLASGCIEKATIFNAQKNYTQAKRLLDKVAKHIPTQPGYIQIDFYNERATALKNSGNYKGALADITYASQLQDSIQTALLDSKVAELETKYQTEKKEKENLQLKEEKAQQSLQLQKENLQKWLLLGGLFITALVLGIFVFYYRKNKRQKNFIEQLQRELHHRTKNNLAIIDSLIEEIKENADRGNITQRLTDLQNRIGSINEVHKRLHQDTKLTHINFSKYIDSLANNITNSFDNSNIIIDKNIPQNLKIETAKIFPLGLIINEFITNSFKYAFPKGKQGKVRISITEENTSYTLSLADNGKGLPTDFDSNTLDSFGIEVMQLLSKQLKGTFDLDGTNGVQLTINFPKN